MGFISNIFGRSERRDTPLTPNCTAQVDDVLLRALLGGDTINTETAMSIPAVANAVNRVAAMVAILSVKLYELKTDKDGREITTEIKGDPRTFLLNVDGNDTLTSYNTRYNLAKDYLLEKGAFLYIKKSRGDIESLIYCPPDQVNAVVNDTDPLHKDGKYLVMGQQYELFDFVAVLRNSKNGIFGEGLRGQITKVMQTALNNILYEMGVTRKGGAQKGFLQSERELSKPAMEELKSAWRQMFSTNEENMMVLNKGITFTPANDNAVDLQINQRKQTLAKEIDGVFGIHNEKFDDIFRDAVVPVLEAIESALNKTMLTEEEKQNRFFQFDKTEVLKASLKERYEAYRIASDIGVLTKNEIRDKEDLQPIDGLDVVGMGLGDVLFDVKTKTYYTPNTGDTKKFDEDIVVDEEKETDEEVKNED
jgi:HK97 family phage portal protein